MNRKFGFELEFSEPENMTIDQVAELIKPAIHNENMLLNIYHESSTAWTLKHDGSCGLELTSPALASTKENFQKIYNTILCIKRMFIGRNLINARCGLHVHIQIKDFKNIHLAKMLNLLLTYEKALLKIQAGSRGRISRNSFVYLLDESKSEILNYVDHLKNYCPNDKINIDTCPHNFKLHPNSINFRKITTRMEVRWGSGTLRPTKIINWIQLLLFIVECAKNNENVGQNYLENEDITNFQQWMLENNSHTWIDERRIILNAWINKRLQDLATYEAERHATANG